MLYDSMSVLGKKVNGRYLLVNIIARRARDIQDIAEKTGQVLVKKPVSYAIEEMASDALQYDLVES